VARPKKILIVVSGMFVVALIGYYFLGQHITPEMQEPLADLNTQSLDSLKTKFNQNADRTRIILLLSPT
jgi:hypothetical protein